MTASPNITTHVLDTDLGRPARGVPVTLYRVNGNSATRVGAGVTDEDGRVRGLLEGALEAGSYRLEFDLAGYARSRGSHSGFFVAFATDFEIRDTNRSYHVPLIISPHSGMSYLGS